MSSAIGARVESGDREVKWEACMIQAEIIKLRIINLVEAAWRLQK